MNEITPRLHNQLALCCTLWTGQKHGGTSLESRCNLLGDAVAATVQLAWLRLRRAGLSFSQTPVAFQLGKEKYFHLTGNY